MRLFRFIGSLVITLLLAASVQAQTTPPLRFQDEGVPLALRYKLNFIGSVVSCADNSGSKRTDCTWTAISTVTADSPLGGSGTTGSHLTCTSCLTGSPTTTGDIFYSTSGTTALSRIAAVASGSVLASNGTGAGPTYVSSLTGFTLSSPVVSNANGTAGTPLIAFSAAESFGAAITASESFTNTTVATVGAQKASQATEWCGNGWKTAATAGSQPVCTGFQTLPIQNTTNPSASTVWYTNINGAGRTARLNFIYDPVALTQGIYSGATAATSGVTMTAGNLILQDGTAVDAITLNGGLLTPSGGNLLQLGTAFKYFQSIFVTETDYVSTSGVAPTATCGTGAGTGATCTTSTSSNGVGGVLHVVTGTTPATSGATIATVGIGTNYLGFNATNAVCIAQAQFVQSGVSVYATGNSKTTLTIVNGGATALSGTVDISYQCMGVQ